MNEKVHLKKNWLIGCENEVACALELFLISKGGWLVEHV
jgi:hypothetical protein